MLITDKQELLKYYSNHMVWVGIPGVERTKSGRVFVTAYTGKTKETYGNYCFLLKSDNEQDFGEPIDVTFLEGEKRCYDPALWIDPLERLWFIWNVMPGEEVYASICENPDADELEFSDPIYIGRGVMLNKPTVLANGEWLFPIALWDFNLHNNLRESELKDDDESAAFVYKTTDNGKTFVKLGGVAAEKRSFDEHMVLEQQDGVLRMLIRTYYGIAESFSSDGGKSWSIAEDSLLKGPCSRFFVCRLQSGRVLLINHHEYNGRNNLTAFLSDDDGKTFNSHLLLDERDNVSYPDATLDEDGNIYITYDRERAAFLGSMEQVYGQARELLIAKITENDIINGSIVTDGSYLKRVVFSLGRLDPSDGDPFLD